VDVVDAAEHGGLVHPDLGKRQLRGVERVDAMLAYRREPR
jgi:hypothetical protein